MKSAFFVWICQEKESILGAERNPDKEIAERVAWRPGESEAAGVKLVLVRHGESEWNRKNLFTGWTDVGLSESGFAEAKDAGALLKQDGFDFDLCFTSYLKRAIRTLNLILERLDREWLPIVKTWKLNERHYGALQGLNKSETAERFGAGQVKIWRRSYGVRPPALGEDDPRSPKLQEQYRNVPPSQLPLCESLQDTIARVVPYYEKVIKAEMRGGKRVLIAAHGNSIRALVKHLENLSETEIVGVNIPTGIPLVYEFDEQWNVARKYFLGDPDRIRAKIESVSHQGDAAPTA